MEKVTVRSLKPGDRIRPSVKSMTVYVVGEAGWVPNVLRGVAEADGRKFGWPMGGHAKVILLGQEEV